MNFFSNYLTSEEMQKVEDADFVDLTDQLIEAIWETRGILYLPPGLIWVNRNNIIIPEDVTIRGHGDPWDYYGLELSQSGTTFAFTPTATMQTTSGGMLHQMFEMMFVDREGDYAEGGAREGSVPDYRHSGGLQYLSINCMGKPAGGLGLRGVRQDNVRNVTVVRSGGPGFWASSWEYSFGNSYYNGPTVCNGLGLDDCQAYYCDVGFRLSGGDSNLGKTVTGQCATAGLIAYMNGTEFNHYDWDCNGETAIFVSGDTRGRLTAQESHGVGVVLANGSKHMKVFVRGQGTRVRGSDGQPVGPLLPAPKRTGLIVRSDASGIIDVTGGQSPYNVSGQAYLVDNRSPDAVVRAALSINGPVDPATMVRMVPGTYGPGAGSVEKLSVAPGQMIPVILSGSAGSFDLEAKGGGHDIAGTFSFAVPTNSSHRPWLKINAAYGGVSTNDGPALSGGGLSLGVQKTSMGKRLEVRNNSGSTLAVKIKW